MKSLCLFSLGLLLLTGCSDTATDYEVNKPVITEPVPQIPAEDPVDSDSDLDGDLDDNDALDATGDTNDATPNSAAPGAVNANPPGTSGAIETDITPDDSETSNP